MKINILTHDIRVLMQQFKHFVRNAKNIDSSSSHNDTNRDYFLIGCDANGVFAYARNRDNIALKVKLNAQTQQTIEHKDFTGIDSIITEFKALIPYKKINELCKKIKTEFLTIEFQHNKIIFTAEKTTIQCSLYANAEHFQYFNMQGFDNWSCFSLNAQDLKQSLEKIQYAMAVNDSREFLNGSLFKLLDNNMTVVATDAHRLAVNSIAITSKQNNATSVDTIIPRNVVEMIIALCTKETQEMTIEVCETREDKSDDKNGFVRIITENWTIECQPINGRYPDYNRVIPVNHTRAAIFNRIELKAAMERTSIVGLDKLNTLKLAIHGSAIIVSITNDDNDIAKENITIENISNSNETFNVNYRYIEELLMNVKEDQFKLSYSDNQATILLTPINESDSFKYAVMPLRA